MGNQRMKDSDRSIKKQYGTDNLLERIFGALVMSGKDPFSLTVDDLAAVDQFHTRGRNSTIELSELAKPQSTERVLDVGCGIGGSARYLANTFDCRVTGIDLTPEYIKVAKRLTDLVNLDQKQVDFFTESATSMSFDDESFDIVWTEHAQMNVPDKRAFYHEIARVLKPGGRLVFHDVFRTEDGITPAFPLPWADHPSISFLITPKDAGRHIHSSGLRLKSIQPRSEESTLAFEKALARIETGEPHPLGLHLLMGSNTHEKIANHLQNLKNKTTAVAMGLAIKT